MLGISKEKKSFIVIASLIIVVSSIVLILNRASINELTKASAIHAPIVP